MAEARAGNRLARGVSAIMPASDLVNVGINERDGGTLYNAQLLFDADGALIQHRRKISSTLAWCMDRHKQLQWFREPQKRIWG